MSKADSLQQVSMAGDFLRATSALEEGELGCRITLLPPSPFPKKGGKEKPLAITGTPSITFLPTRSNDKARSLLENPLSSAHAPFSLLVGTKGASTGWGLGAASPLLGTGTSCGCAHSQGEPGAASAFTGMLLGRRGEVVLGSKNACTGGGVREKIEIEVGGEQKMAQEDVCRGDKPPVG